MSRETVRVCSVFISNTHRYLQIPVMKLLYISTMNRVCHVFFNKANFRSTKFDVGNNMFEDLPKNITLHYTNILPKHKI